MPFDNERDDLEIILDIKLSTFFVENLKINIVCFV